MKLNNDMLKLNLQMFADGEEENPEPETPDETEEQKEALTQEEVNRLIAQAKSKAKEEAKKDIEQSHSSELKQLKEELEEIKKKDMTTSQLKEYEEQETQRKLEERDAEIARLQSELTNRDMRDKAMSTLSEKGLPINDDVLNFVVKETAEETLKAIDAIGNLLTAQKREQAKQGPPLGSGGVGAGSVQDNDDLFKKARITQF